jgi:hypothetical protein
MKNQIALLYRVAGIAALFCILSNSALAEKAIKLPAYQVDLSLTSVSGLSSGAFMAAQFQAAYSGTLVGAGIVAGGPYYCAGSSALTPFVLNATTICMNPQPGMGPDAHALLEKAKVFARSGLIDDLGNLKKQKVYLFSGKADHVVITPVVDQTAAFYQLAGTPAQNIKYVQDINAGHAIITSNSKNVACADTAAPYINDCKFTQSHDILKHIYGDLKPPASKLSGRIVKFDQSEFVKSFLASMSDDAYLYVPGSCETETCKVHVAFHGCGQGAAQIGDLFYRTTGYNELADTNNIIVLYPQAEVSNGFFSAFNPKGCWDFWGYSSFNQLAPNFYTKQAPQMSAVKAMLDRLGQGRK